MGELVAAGRSSYLKRVAGQPVRRPDPGGDVDIAGGGWSDHLPAVILIAMCAVLLIRGATADPGERLGASWPGTLVAAGAVVWILSITWSSSTPIPNTIVVAAVIALLAGFVPINFPAEMTSVAPWSRSWCCGFVARSGGRADLVLR